MENMNNKKCLVILMIFSLFIPGCIDNTEAENNEELDLGVSITYIDSMLSNYPTVIVFATSTYGNITEFGLDYDLDGLVDTQIENSQPTEIDVSLGNQTRIGDGDRCIFSFGLFAMDDLGNYEYEVGLRNAECQ